jgi:hypothetical protein
MSIYTLHLQKIEQGKPALEVTWTVIVDDEQQGSDAHSVAQRDELCDTSATLDPPHHDDIVVSDAAVSYSVTIQLDHQRDSTQNGEGHITFSHGRALARLP